LQRRKREGAPQLRLRLLLLAGFCVVVIAVAAAAYSILSRQYNPVIIAIAAITLFGSLGLLLTFHEREFERRTGLLPAVMRIGAAAILVLLFAYVGIRIQLALHH
jgi:drug/metabolite transporter (DMT)-like permease